MQSSDLNGIIHATKAASKAQKVMDFVIETIPYELITTSDESSFAASSFLAGLAIEFGVQMGVPNRNLSVVVEAALSSKIGKDMAEWYASNLSELLEREDSKLAIDAGRSAAMLFDEDSSIATDLLHSLLRNAAKVST